MTENILPDDLTTTTPRRKLSGFPRWLMIVIPIGLVGICCIGLVIAGLYIFNVNVKGGGYSIEEVILSKNLKDGQPVDITDVFKPSDTILCTVKTSGVDGIIGMRWYLGVNLVYEYTGKTTNNTISTYIQSNKSAVLPEGKYHVDIFTVDEPFKTVYFEVKAYHPTMNPPISVPTGHRNIEVPWYPEVPFVFDEVWKIGDTEWKVNEVKVILMDNSQEYFVAVVIDTDMNNLAALSESQAKDLARPIALYALKNGYVEKARSLQIDGKYYDLDQYIFVILKNPSNQLVYRVELTMEELVK